ncbi:MAG: ribose-5-phosphate isomerase [Clostridia bacterium]|nr:ribose-5-phosphate isomerase [Clostridia bacterium]
MKVAVINEISAKEKNPDIMNALKKAGVTAVNAGMCSGENAIELTYIHTGLMAAILLNLGAVDMTVGGCGTGEGFLISSMQYPNVFCGLISEPLDAWLFSQINAGNCISLALNKGYGWAGNLTLEYIFEKLFKDVSGRGFPVERSVSQAESRERLKNISRIAHQSMENILSNIEKALVERIFTHQPFVELVKGECRNKELQQYILANFVKV